MTLKLIVLTLKTAAEGDAIRETILTAEPDATIDIDVDSQLVTVEGLASEETFKQLIEAAGHRFVA